MSCSLPQSWGGCLWFGLVIQAPSSYCNGCSNCAHSYDHTLAKADTSAGAGDCSMYFENGQINVLCSCDRNSGFFHDLIFVAVSELDAIVWFNIGSVCKRSRSC